jgi:hypothetical protein
MRVNTYTGGSRIGATGVDMGNVIASGSNPPGTGPVTVADGTGQYPDSTVHATGTGDAASQVDPRGFSPTPEAPSPLIRNDSGPPVGDAPSGRITQE